MKTCKTCNGTGEIDDPTHPMHPSHTGDGDGETWCLDCDGYGTIPETDDEREERRKLG